MVILMLHSGKSTGVHNNIKEGSVLLDFPRKTLQRDNEPAYITQDPETEAAKWNSATITCIICTCAFTNVTKKFKWKSSYAEVGDEKYFVDLTFS